MTRKRSADSDTAEPPVAKVAKDETKEQEKDKEKEDHSSHGSSNSDFEGSEGSEGSDLEDATTPPAELSQLLQTLVSQKPLLKTLRYSPCHLPQVTAVHLLAVSPDGATVTIREEDDGPSRPLRCQAYPRNKYPHVWVGGSLQLFEFHFRQAAAPHSVSADYDPVDHHVRALLAAEQRLLH